MLTTVDSSPATLALRTLEALGPLSADDKNLFLDALSSELKPHRNGADLGDSGDQSCWFLVRGWACRARILPDGRRQIFNFLMPGDVVGLRRLDQAAGLYRVVALTAGATLDATALRPHIASDQFATGLAGACKLQEDRQTASLFDQITRLGSRTAHEATASLFLDLYRRSESIGQADNGLFFMPLTQAVLSDALGVSPIQINRIMARLRSDGLMAFGAGWAQVTDLPGLVSSSGQSRFKRQESRRT